MKLARWHTQVQLPQVHLMEGSGLEQTEAAHSTQRWPLPLRDLPKVDNLCSPRKEGDLVAQRGGLAILKAVFWPREALTSQRWPGLYRGVMAELKIYLIIIK